MRALIFTLLGALGCASSSQTTAPQAATKPPPLPEKIRSDILAKVEQEQRIAPVVSEPISQGELPWWHGLKANIYRFNGSYRAIAVGISKDHHHIAEGLLMARVKARLLARKASERVAFKGPMPEPQLLDLFVTRKGKILALHSMPIPESVSVPKGIATLSVPKPLLIRGHHRIGRHIFDGTKHLFMECDVEGPLTNPDWGHSRASVRP